MNFELNAPGLYIYPMKQLFVCIMAASFAVPALAEERNKSLMEQGAELFFEGLRQEMEPTLDGMLKMAEQFGPSILTFFEEMGPALADLADKVEDWSAYQAPEILPNGDIIIRKKTEPAPPEQQPKPEDEDTFVDI